MWDHRKLLILVILVLFLAPLCAVDKIDSLTSTSTLCVPLAIVFVVVTFTAAIIKLVEGKIEPPRMTPDFGSKKAILDLLMSNACVYHFNIQQIYIELEGRSPHKLNRVSRITTVICVLVYVSTAISGYLLFGKDTEANVLTNCDKDLGIRFSSALNYIVRIEYVLHLILVFPVIHFSLRQTVDAIIFEGSVLLRELKKVSGPNCSARIDLFWANYDSQHLDSFQVYWSNTSIITFYISSSYCATVKQRRDQFELWGKVFVLVYVNISYHS